MASTNLFCCLLLVFVLIQHVESDKREERRNRHKKIKSDIANAKATFTVTDEPSERDYSKYLGIDYDKFQERKKHRQHRNHDKPRKTAKRWKRNKRALTEINDETALPAAFDWRKETPCRSVCDVRDQFCGNCWASSSAAAISDRYCLFTGKDKIFSEAQITTCTYPERNGCNGGVIEHGVGLLYTTTGVVSGGDEYVQPTQPKGCLPKSYMNTIDTNGVTLTCPAKCTDASSFDSNFANDFGMLYDNEWENITMAQRIEKMKWELFKYGPMVVHIDAFPDFQSYNGGVYQHVPSIVCPDGEHKCGHAIRLIGWGTDVVNGKSLNYWLIVNQWTTNWGDKNDPGTAKIIQGDEIGGIDSYCAWPYPKEAFTN